MLDKMKELVRTKETCVLATVSQGRPHCSLMAYVTDDDCSEIYMATQKDSTKYRNLMENPMVSLLIDTRDEHQGQTGNEARALTVAGTLQRIDDPEMYDRVHQKLLDRHPRLDSFLNQPDATIICIKVSSFLLLDGLTDAYFEEIKNS
jgi:nitroimidazol reductase NimA-like FMN-containing flavoprotein (pyridoxamine 5'-phosphate oxidase superfamily)